VPADLDIHLICDNYGTHETPAIKAWLARHPRFHMHVTPTGSSWINQVERWFGFLTEQKIRRGVHKSVQALEADFWGRPRGRASRRPSGSSARPVRSQRPVDQMVPAYLAPHPAVTRAGRALQRRGVDSVRPGDVQPTVVSGPAVPGPCGNPHVVRPVSLVAAGDL